jgi:hypothetical protein
MACPVRRAARWLSQARAGTVFAYYFDRRNGSGPFVSHGDELKCAPRMHARPHAPCAPMCTRAHIAHAPTRARSRTRGARGDGLAVEPLQGGARALRCATPGCNAPHGRPRRASELAAARGMRRPVVL